MSSKDVFGEVHTPKYIVDLMADFVREGEGTFNRCIEAGAGDGRITKALKELSACETSRFHLTEIQERFHSELEHLGEVSGDFLGVSGEYDLVVGNPPYNSGGAIWVPSNPLTRSSNDGVAVWRSFLRHGLSLLKPHGVLVFLIPAMWMKPDRARLYEVMTSLRIERIRTFDADETRRLFKSNAQTPLSLVRVRKSAPIGTFRLYNPYTHGFESYGHIAGMPIPMRAGTIITKIRTKLGTANIGIDVIKCSNPHKNTMFSHSKSPTTRHSCVVATHLGKASPYLVVRYTDKPTPYWGCQKLILGHLMHGIPFHDKDGIYGIGKRDLIVILGDEEMLSKTARFLRSRIVQYLFRSTRYRMRFLEKYAFSFLPKIESLPDWSHEDDIYDFFNLTNTERNEIHSNTTDRLSPEFQSKCSEQAAAL